MVRAINDGVSADERANAPEPKAEIISIYKKWKLTSLNNSTDFDYDMTKEYFKDGTYISIKTYHNRATNKEEKGTGKFELSDDFSEMKVTPESGKSYTAKIELTSSTLTIGTDKNDYIYETE